MPKFITISKHSPENCPAFNEKAKRVRREVVGKFEELLKKHGVKSLGVWSATGEHTSYGVWEAPSLEAFTKFRGEPEVWAIGAYDTRETKLVIGLEEAMQLLK
jgi:uncharacterized protein with GYD domain